MEIEFNELVFHVWKTSSLNSEDGPYHWTRKITNVWLHLMFGCVCREMDLIRSSSYQIVLREFVVGKSISCEGTWSFSMYGKRVHWTRFPYMEIEFIELGFCTWKPSSLNSISMFSPHQFFLNRVHWTWIVINEISLKRLLTNDIVWVL